MRNCATTLIALVSVSALPAHGQRAESILGATVRLTMAGGTAPISGELLAVERDTLWLMVLGIGIRPHPIEAVREASVPQGGLTAARVGVWAVVASVITGTALTAACASVEDASCGGVFPFVLGSWLTVGGLSAALSGSSTRSVDPRSLAPFARFPQGWPADARNEFVP